MRPSLFDERVERIVSRLLLPPLSCLALAGCLANETPPLAPLTDIGTATAARSEERRPLEPLLTRDEAAARAEAARQRAAEAGDARALAAADAVENKESAALQPLAPSTAEAVALAGDEVVIAAAPDAAIAEVEADAEALVEDPADAENAAEDEALEEVLEPEEEIALGVARPVEEPAYTPPIQPLQGRSWLDTGKYLLSQSEPRDAEAAFRRSIAIEGVSVEALTGAGIAAHVQGHLQMARSFLIRARLLDPDDVDVNNALGTTLMGLGDYAGAYQAFRTAFVVSSGSSEVAALNLERTRIRANRIATAQPVEDREIVFDLSRTGPSEFLLHDPGSDVEALLPDAPPAQIVSVDTEAALAIESGADPATVVVETDSAAVSVEEETALATVVTTADEAADPAAVVEPDGADVATVTEAEALDTERSEADGTAEPALPGEAIVVTETPPIETAPLAPIQVVEERKPAPSVARSRRPSNEGRSRELPPEILAAIEGAGASTLAPLAESAEAAKEGKASSGVTSNAGGGLTAAPAEEPSRAQSQPIAGNAGSSDNADDRPSWLRAGD